MKSKSKIAFFLPTLASGGAQRVTLNLINGLKFRGYNVNLVLSNAKGELVEEVNKSIPVIDLKQNHVSKSLPNLAKYFSTYKPSIVISAIEHANVAAIIAKMLSKTNTKNVITLHTNITNAIKYREKKTLKNTMLPFIIKKIYPKSDSIVAVSKGVADDFSKFLGIKKNRIKVIYNPVITSHLFEKARETIDHPWFLSGSPPVIISIGRLSEEKDYFTLLNAFSEVRKVRIARLLILGDGENRRKLEVLISKLGLVEDVELAGYKSNPYSYLSKSTLMVLSSKAEGLPTVLIEALALGVPIISSDCESGPSEILDEGRLGKLVPVGDASSLAHEMISMLDNIILCRAKALEAKKETSNYRIEKTLDQYSSLLECLFHDRHTADYL